jgi:hypothetical protein
MIRNQYDLEPALNMILISVEAFPAREVVQLDDAVDYGKPACALLKYRKTESGLMGREKEFLPFRARSAHG